MTASHWSVSYTLLAILLPASSLAAASKHSRRIEKLTKEAQAVSRWPINVVRIPFARGPLQGHTNGLGDVWGSQGWEVHAMAGPSREYNDAVLAHELGHIILNSRGFAAFYREKPNNPESASLVHEIAQELFNCFPDELIDHETAKRGFTPRLLLETYVHSTEENLNNSKAGDFESSSDTARKAYALGLFCTGMRLSTRSMRRYEEKVKAKYGPTLIERERTLSKQFEGLRCQMDDSAGCFHLTQKLRDAVGMHGVIVFADPLTHQPE